MLTSEEKFYFKVLERQNLQNETISESYTGDDKSKYSSNPRQIFKSEKVDKAATTKFFTKFLTERKYLMNNLTFVSWK